MTLLLMLMLTLYSYHDIRRKKLPNSCLISGLCVTLIVGTVYRVGSEGQGVGEGLFQVIIGMMPGMLLTILSYLLKEKIGNGDGVVLSLIGGLTGIKEAVEILMAAIALSFIYSCILLIFFGKRKDYCFPFVPFYLVGVVMIYILRRC